MRAVLALLLIGCRGDPPASTAVTGRDAVQVQVQDAPPMIVSERISEPLPGVWLAQLSPDGSRAVLETLPGGRGPRERVLVDLATLRVVERGALIDEVPGTTLHRRLLPASPDGPRYALAEGARIVAGTDGYSGVWRRAGDAIVALLHEVGAPTCFVRVAGSPAAVTWRHCIAPGEALDAALSPHGVWGVWTTRDPLEDSMRVHAWNLANDAAGPTTRGLGVPIISDAGRVLLRGASENCELRGEMELVCLRDQRLVVQLLQGTSN